MRFRAICALAGLAALVAVAWSPSFGQKRGAHRTNADSPTVTRSDAEWRKRLTAEQYDILRKKGTERPFSGKYWNTTTPGTYYCAGCGQALFASTTKFDAGCGWPSFWQAIDKKNIVLKADESLGMRRTEVLCRKCGGHLGHVFDDGPKPTGLRFCINSGAITLKPAPAKGSPTAKRK